MYENFDRSIVSKYIYQDEIYKGFSVHSVKALALWEKLLNCLLDNFMEDYHDLKTIQVIPQISNIDFLEDFYGDYFYRIKNRIPSFSDDNGNRRFITTDALPYLVSSLNIGDEVFSTYTVVRPRSFAVKPFLREEFIRYFQFVIASDESDILRNIDKIKH